MSFAVVGAGGSRPRLSTWSARRPAHRARRWQTLALASALPACTLTAESFEPSRVDAAEGQLGRESAGALPQPADAGVAVPSSARGGEGNQGSTLGGVALDPAAVGGEGASSSAPEPADGPTDGSGLDAGDGSTGDAAPEPSAMSSCPGQQFASSCYQAFAEPLAWDVAEQRCVEWGGHLASVQSSEEDAFLGFWPTALSVALADGSGIWLGGTDAASDGAFRWWDASPVVFLGWAPEQPDNGPGVDCIEKRNDGTALWFDRRCDEARAYLCERPL